MDNIKCFINAKITTMGAMGSDAESLVVKGGQIVYVGSNDEAKQFLDNSSEVIDMDGKRILPGFIDAHMHLRLYPKSYYGVNLAGLNSIEKYQDTIKTYLKDHPEAIFVMGSGWSEALMPGTGLKKEDLDAISTDIPIVMVSDGFHSLWVNSKTLRMAGIHKESGEIENGIVERLADGEPSGTLREGWIGVIENLLPDYSVDEYKEAFIAYSKYANSLGVIGIFDAWLIPDTNATKALKELALEKAMNLYVKGAYTAEPSAGIKQISDFSSIRYADSVNEHFSIDTVKIFCDGVVESKTACLLEPYRNNREEDPDFAGEPIWSDTELNDIVSESMKHNFQVHVHCIGDGAVRQTLNAFEKAKESHHINLRNTIAHIELINEKDIGRFKELDIIALLNPYWFEVDDYYYNNHDFIGKENADRTYVLKSFLRRNINCAMGSDFPVTDIPNPLIGIELGVTRTVSKYYHPWATDYESGRFNFPLGDGSENANLNEMVKMATIDSAYCLFMDKYTGSIEIGKNADFIVLENDIFNIPISELSNTKIHSTYFKGERVYCSDELKEV